MDEMGSNWGKVVLAVAGGLGVAGFIMFRGMSQSMVVGPGPVVVGPATTQVAGEGEWKTWEIPALASPQQYERGEDAAINDLIERHNANQDRLGKVSLRGQCVWMLDMEGEPRAMTIEFDRAKGGASMTCGKDTGWTQGETVHMSPRSAMNIDALYLLAFRKYNPKGFEAASPTTQAAKDKAVVVAKSDRETLSFDRESGRLVQAEFKLKEGVVQAKFSDFKAVGKDGTAFIPMFLDLMVPVDLFPFERTRDGRVTLKIDPKSVHLAD